MKKNYLLINIVLLVSIQNINSMERGPTNWNRPLNELIGDPFVSINVLARLFEMDKKQEYPTPPLPAQNSRPQRAAAIKAKTLIKKITREET